jgi:hypothetical protein
MCHDRVITPARQVSTSDGDRPSVWVKVTVTKPVWFRVRRLRQVLKPKNVT